MYTTSAITLCSKGPCQLPSNQVLLAYGLFLGVASAVFHFVARGEFSAILTLSGMFQCLATVLLVLRSLTSGSAAGISARSLAMEALALCCKLASTLFFDGYLPVDDSGDWIYQATDVLTLGLILFMLYLVLDAQKSSYDVAEDSLPVLPVIVSCFLGAATFHADLNERPLFDSLWMAGLFLGVFAVLPQLWLISRTGGRPEALTSHFIALTALARVLSGTFMFHVREDLTSRPVVQGYNHAPWAILGAHAVHLVLLADFGYYYAKGIAKAGLACALDLDIV